MGKVGHPHKTHTPEDEERREKTSRHLKAYRAENSLTQKELGGLIGISDQTIRRYEKKDTDMSSAIAEDFEKKTGIYFKYWLGLTDCKTESEYLQEQEWVAEVVGQLEQAQERQTILWSGIENAFDLCGYTLKPAPKYTALIREYSTREDKDVVSFWEAKDKNDPEYRFYCTKDEVMEIVAALKETISFWGYKKNMHRLIRPK